MSTDVASFSGLVVTGPEPETDPDPTFNRFTLEVAFTTDPGEASVWTDVTAYMMEFHVKRGRQMQLDRIDAGTMTVKLRNEDRRFDPTHDTSPYYPDVLPMRKIRLRATHNAITYNLFTGFVQSWPQAWTGPHVGFSTVQAVDAFLPLSKVDVGDGSTWPREFSGPRVTRILDAAGWPSGDREIDAGYLEVPEVTIPLGSGVTALEQLKEVADSELGAFFIDGAGKAVFHDRHHRRGASYLTSAGEFGDANTDGLKYRDIVMDTDADRIWNDVQVIAAGSEAAQAEDSASQTKYLRRTLARSISAAREAEAPDQAAYLLSLYKEPRYRLSGIQVAPTTDAQWVQAFAREFGDHITVNRWPQQVGDVITQECGIESVEYRGAPAVFDVRWTLSTPAYSEVDWWLLGDATYGVLGSTTKLVY